MSGSFFAHLKTRAYLAHASDLIYLVCTNSYKGTIFIKVV